MNSSNAEDYKKEKSNQTSESHSWMYRLIYNLEGNDMTTVQWLVQSWLSRTILFNESLNSYDGECFGSY